jgi:hypothetical protein
MFGVGVLFFLVAVGVDLVCFPLVYSGRAWISSVQLLFGVHILLEVWWTGVFLTVLCSLGVFPAAFPAVCGVAAGI